MNTRKLLLPLFAALFGLAASAYAQTVTTEATVAKVTGAATVTMPDGSTTALTPGMKVPQGATIKTGADGDVYIESHAGYITSIKKDSEVAVAELSVTTEGGKVKEEKTLLDLKSGNLVAKLDPTKKAVNNYQVRTPKGVAAARGTVFTVQYKGGNYAIAVVNGVVTITPPAGGGIVGTNVGIQVNAGNAVASLNGATIGTAVPLNEAIVDPTWSASAGQDITNLLSLAAATVAVAAENHIGGTTSAEAADVARTIIQAVPNAAPAIAALVAASAPTQSAAVIQITQEVAPAQAAAVQQAVQQSTPPATPPASTPTAPTPPATTPQPIDPSTVSRSG